jgi:hypothetical protein
MTGNAMATIKQTREQIYKKTKDSATCNHKNGMVKREACVLVGSY